MQPQAEGAQDTSATGGTATADQTQTATQAGTTSQAQTSQTTAATTPGQDPNQQPNPNSQAQALVQSAVPTSEQWYQQQQQYQQYYQQYPGYDPYQQHYQQYYPYQQPTVPQYQQQQLQAHTQQVTVQHQPQAYMQPQPNIQPQPQPQTQPHGQSQSHPHVQAPSVAQPQSQAQVNLQQQPQTAVQPHSQTQTQTQLAPSLPHPQAQPYSQAQPQSTQPHPQQHVPMPQYQQPHNQMQHPQLQIQQQAHQHPASQPQLHSQAQLQAPVQHHSQPHPHLNPNVQSQMQLPSAHAVTGHQSYPQPHQQAHLVAPQQHPMQMNPHGGLQPQSQHPGQMPSQFPQQHPPMRPLQSHGTLPNQQQGGLLPSPGQGQNIPPAQQQSVQQPGHPIHQRPVMQPVQQPMAQQYVQQQQPFVLQGPFVPQQMPTQSQLRPQGQPHSYPQHTPAYPLQQQNVPLSHGSQNVAGRPMLPNHGLQSHPYPQHAGGVQARPMHPGASQPAANQGNILRNNNQVQVSTEQQFGVTLRPTISVRQGDHGVVKSVGDQAAESSSENAVKKETNDFGAASGLGADAGDVITVKFETDIKSGDDGDAEPGSHAVENGELVKRMVKEEATTERTSEHSKSSRSGELVAEVKKDVSNVSPKHLDNSAMEERESQDDLLLKKTPLQESEHIEKLSGKLQRDASGIQQPSTVTDEGSQILSTTSAPVSSSPAQNVIPKGTVSHGPLVDEYRGFPPPGQVQSGGFMQPSHPGPIADQGRNFGPSTLQQRPGAPLLQTPPHALPHYTQTAGHPQTQFRPQGPGHAPEHFQSPVFKQSQGLEIPPGGISGPGSTASFGRGPGYYGFPQQNQASQGPHSQGHALPTHAAASRMSQGESVGPPPFGMLPPGAIDSHGGMARAPPHGPEGLMGQQRPTNPMEAELFINHRPNYMDGRRPDPHVPGSLGQGPVGQPSGLMRSNGLPGLESSSTHGLRDDRFKPFPDERSNSFQPGRHVTDRGEFEDDLKQFPRPSRLDAEPVPKFGSYSSRPHDMGPHGLNYDSGLKLDAGAGSARSRFLPPFDGGERPVGLSDSSNIHPDFLGPVTGYARHHMDGLAHRSPVREYPGISRGFGGLPGPMGPDDFDGRESRRFGDPTGKSFHESRFPILPSHLRRGEFEGPGKLRMSEHIRSGDLIGLDGHLRRGEHLGPHNLPGHLRLGEPIGFGDYPGHPRMGELAGLGNFEPFGAGNRPGHPRFGEPGFRSSFSLQGFPNDAGIDTVK